MRSSNDGSSNHAKIQPKFKDCHFDSEKNKTGLLTWMMLISNLVRNMSGGMGIEHFLDWYLKRNLKSLFRLKLILHHKFKLKLPKQQLLLT